MVILYYPCMNQIKVVSLHSKHQEQSLIERTRQPSFRIKLPVIRRQPAQKGQPRWQRYDVEATYIHFKNILIMAEKQKDDRKDYQTHVYYLKFALQFVDYQIEDLVASFNREVNNKGWVGMRAYHDRALIDEFIRRGIDVSCVHDGKNTTVAVCSLQRWYYNLLVIPYIPPRL